MSETAWFIGSLTRGQNPEIKCDSRLLPWGFRNSEQGAPPCSHQLAVLVHQDELIFICSRTQSFTCSRNIQAALTLGQRLPPRSVPSSGPQPCQEQNCQGEPGGSHRSQSSRERGPQPPSIVLYLLKIGLQPSYALASSIPHPRRRRQTQPLRGSKRLKDVLRSRLITVPFSFFNLCLQSVAKEISPIKLKAVFSDKPGVH